MQKEPEEFRPVTVGSEDGAEHIGNVHARHADALAAGENRGEYDGAGKSPN